MVPGRETEWTGPKRGERRQRLIRALLCSFGERTPEPGQSMGSRASSSRSPSCKCTAKYQRSLPSPRLCHRRWRRSQPSTCVAEPSRKKYSQSTTGILPCYSLWRNRRKRAGCDGDAGPAARTGREPISVPAAGAGSAGGERGGEAGEGQGGGLYPRGIYPMYLPSKVLRPEHDPSRLPPARPGDPRTCWRVYLLPGASGKRSRPHRGFLESGYLGVPAPDGSWKHRLRGCSKRSPSLPRLPRPADAWVPGASARLLIGLGFQGPCRAQLGSTACEGAQ